MTYTIDLSEVKSTEELHDLLQEVLPLPDYYGRNLDALYDVLTSFSEPMEIRFINTADAEAFIGEYMQSLYELCGDVREENPEISFIFADTEETGDDGNQEAGGEEGEGWLS